MVASRTFARSGGDGVDPTPAFEAVQATAAAKVSEDVQCAFALGWHVTQLFHFEKVAAESEVRERPVSAPGSLPGIGSLSPTERRELLMRQIQRDLLRSDFWKPTPGGPDVASVATRVAKSAEASDFQAEVDGIHRDILESLTVQDFRLGKSYGLARALAESSILPCAECAADRSKPIEVVKDGQTRLEKPNEVEKRVGDALSKSLGDQFDDGRVFTLQGWLLDLRDSFPQYAADAVSTTLGGWSLWLIRPTLENKDRPDSRDGFDWADKAVRGKIERTLRLQATAWRGLLSGEKDPKTMAGADYYFRAMSSVVRRLARLAVGFLGTAIGLILALAVVVAAIALYVNAISANATGVLAAVVALLSSLGITAGSVGASVKSAWSKAEGPLWEAEVSAAVANAAWHNPAPLGSAETIQLLLMVGQGADDAAEARARHPGLWTLRNIAVGRIGIVLMVVSTAFALFSADAQRLDRDASFFIPPLVVVGFLAAIDAWDILVGLATKQPAPYLALPERIELPDWVRPVGSWLAPIFVITGLLAGHFFWH